MNWVVRKLAGAFLAGVGWKLGADAYEYVKRRVEETTGKKKDEASPEEDGAAEAAAEQGPQ